ncbi:MAG: hypothetical protein Q4C10_01220 [Clostridia bacterium]|nr:hypothetical protein [Clostridia bacterium]
MSYTVNNYPNIRHRVQCGRAARGIDDRHEYADCGLERLRSCVKAKERWLLCLWIDFDCFNKAGRSSGWKHYKARKQWEHNVKTRERHRSSRVRKALKRGKWPFE